LNRFESVGAVWSGLATRADFVKKKEQISRVHGVYINIINTNEND
jgi:hypothetical protein